MGRRLGAATALLRLALAVAVGSAVALLMPSLITTAADTPAAVVLAAVVIAVAAVTRLDSRLATLVTRAQGRHPATGDEAPFVLAGRVTDPLHHPLRPRAPGPA
jgi:hypothetical protein